MNLLEHPCIQACTSRGLSSLTLPGVLAGLDEGNVSGFPELRPHQEAPWHAFLVQIAALAQRATEARRPVGASIWADRLRALSRLHGAGDHGWCLYTSSESDPAILQPADPGGLKWYTHATPDDGLDILVNAKYHDRKFDVARRARPEHWLYALVTMQACAGYDGPRLYQTVRINGAFASRTFLGTAPVDDVTGVIDPSAWWRRDVDTLLSSRPRTAADPVAGSQRPALLWLVPWAERKQLALADLDPWFLDTPRRIRIIESMPGTLVIRRAGSIKPRIDAAKARGVTGDPWTAVHARDGKAFSLPGRLNDRLLLDLLFGSNWTPPLCVRWDPPAASRRLAIVAHGVAKRDKKITGVHQRLVHLPPGAAEVLAAGSIGNDVADTLRADLARLFGAIRDAATDGAGTVAAPRPARHPIRAATNALERELDDLLRFFWDALTSDDVARSDEVRRRRFAAAAHRALGRALANVHATTPSRPLFAARARARLHRSLYFVFNPPDDDRTQPAADGPNSRAATTVG